MKIRSPSKDMRVRRTTEVREDMLMRNVILMVAGAVGAVILGLVYVFNAFGPIDAAVVWWGRVSVGLGIGLGILALTVGAKRTMLCRLMLGLGYTVLAVLQPPGYPLDCLPRFWH